MPEYNGTKREKQLAAANDTALKVKFEVGVEPQVQKYFDKISNDFFQQYLDNSSIVDINVYNDDLNDLLTNHYNDVSATFSQTLRTALGQPDDPEKKNEVNVKIGIALALLQLRHVTTSVRQMNKTTNKDMHAAIAGTIAAATAAGISLSHSQTAKQSKAAFDIKAAGRTGIVSQDQTQFAAESAKDTEYNTLATTGADIGGVNMATADKKKTWMAILDTKTRRAHVEADGQEQPYNKPYTVMDQQLKYPRDTSLGATSKNVMGCRCTSVASMSYPG